MGNLTRALPPRDSTCNTSPRPFCTFSFFFSSPPSFFFFFFASLPLPHTLSSPCPFDWSLEFVHLSQKEKQHHPFYSQEEQTWQETRQRSSRTRSSQRWVFYFCGNINLQESGPFDSCSYLWSHHHHLFLSCTQTSFSSESRRSHQSVFFFFPYSCLLLLYG